MALTPRRWILAALAACALIAVGALRAPSALTRQDPRPLDSLSQKMQAVQWQMIKQRVAAEQVGTLLREATIRDSVLQALPSALDTGLAIYADPAIPSAARAKLVAAAQRQWVAIGSPHSGVPIVAAIVLDTGYFMHNPSRLGTPMTMSLRYALSQDVAFAAYLPRAIGRNECLAIVQLRIPTNEIMGQTSRPNWGSSFDQTMLGQCAYVAAFGAPGTTMESWLRNNSALAVDAYAPGARKPPFRTERIESFESSIDMLYGEDRWQRTVLYSEATQCDPKADIIRGVTGEPISILRRGQCVEVAHGDGLACAAGRLEPCQRAILGDALAGDSLNLDRAMASLEEGGLFYERGRLGPWERALLSDMIQDLGPARFAAVWRSSSPLPEAFQAATGGSIAAWTRDWLRRTYGAAPRLGPMVAPSVLFDALLLTLAALAVAVYVGSRRRLG